MRCFICDYTHPTKKTFYTYPDGKVVCFKCRNESQRIFLSSLGGVVGDATNIEQLLKELEGRIPELFKGFTCPVGRCNCTYKTGCKYLLDNPPLEDIL